MMKFLKKHQKKIDFTLLFLPVLVFSLYWLDQSTWDIGLIRIDDGNKIFLDNRLKEMLDTFIPFILWRIIASYWLKEKEQ